MGEVNVKLKSIPLTASTVVYEAVRGLNYGCTKELPDGVRVEAGQVVPADAIAASPWLLSEGHVRPRKGGANV